MFRLKNFKVLLAVLLLSFTMQDIAAKSWFRLQVEAKCKDTNGNIRNDIGFVAVKFSTQPTEATKRADLIQSHTGKSWGNTLSVTVYMLAKGDGNWQFDHWEVDDDGTLSNSNQEQGTASHNYTSTNKCPGTSSSGNHEHATYYTEHTYYAVFREVVNQVVFAEAQPETLGEVKYLKENAIGDEITLRTYTLDYHNKFLGWVKQGEEDNIITTDRVLTFTITDETKGTYIAKYDDGYNFVRFKNLETGRYMDFTSDDGSLQDLTSLELKSSLDDVISEAGSVIEIHEGDVKSSSGTSKRHYFDYYMQNAKTSKFYDFDPTDPNAVTYGVFLRMPHDVDINVDTWALSTDDNVQSGYRIGDQNGSPHVYLGKRDDADWWIEPMDKDLETKENYFSLDPNKLVEVDGKYYTTLRTSWNILFDPEQMTPYIVKSVDETAGTFEMEAISGNIIPAGTPVIIETKSNDVEENRMVPTLTNATNGAVPSGNLLQHSEKYFPNQAAPVANCKGLIKNANGQLAFGGDALTTVNGNEAYLSVANEVVLPKPIPVTLAQLVANGEVGETYEITDLTSVDVVDDYQLLICKDNNGYVNKDEITANYIDYMHMGSISGLSQAPLANYDQSNWIGLRIPDGKEFTGLVLGNRLSGVVGKLIDAVNPELQLTQVPGTSNDEAAPTDKNLFIAPAFYGVNHQTGKNDKEYFFVQPKPMELANVEMAQWDGSKFIAPVHDEAHPTWNTAELSGEFEFNGAYLINDVNQSELQEGHIYKLRPAVVKLKTRLASGRDGSRQYVVYPLTLEKVTSEEGGVITGLRDLTNPEVIGTDYYNTTGMRSSRPWPGVNIVVTRYSDGSRSAVKVVK